MRKQIEHILLTILIGMSVLLGLTFWLNTNFGFNLFNSEHWHELASLQASGEPININFYISIGVAIAIFIVCLNIIYRPHFRKINIESVVIQKPTVPQIGAEKPLLLPKSTPNLPDKTQPDTAPQRQTDTQIESGKVPATPPVMPNVGPISRPPKLNLPKNMAQIAAAQYAQQAHPQTTQTDKYDAELAEIFTNNGFLVKKNPKIDGFISNLFAIGANEIVWIGGVNCDIEKMKNAILRLESTFRETLEDITITVNAFLVDTDEKHVNDNRVKIFHNIDELKQYISENHGAPVDENNREDFDAYSEYIDTVLTLLYKI